MAKKVLPEYTAFFEGIADFNKTGGAASYESGRNIDHRSDTRSITLNPAAMKESGSIVTDLIKWCVNPPTQPTIAYLYGEGGNFYKREGGVYTLLRTVSGSHGNGMGWFGEDNFIYYTLDDKVGRYGPLNSTNPQFTDDYFGSQGGQRTNTNSLDLEASSSQYAARADTASLSLAGDLTLEAQIKPESLPTGANSSTLISKWDEMGNLRSYKFDIVPVSSVFGSGADGALTISANTTDAPIDSACTGTAGNYTLSATNAGFAADQVILIHQSKGTNAGQWERNKIQSYTAGTITLVTALLGTYTAGAQVLVLKQYTNVTVDAGKVWSAKAWNGTVGGILSFLATGTVTNNGTILADGNNSADAFGDPGPTGTGAVGIGFKGGDASHSVAYQGDGDAGTGVPGISNNGSGGGGSFNSGSGANGGGGGGNGTAGQNGIHHPGDGAAGTGGGETGNSGLTNMTFGGGGGGGTVNGTGGISGGGAGGGIIFITAVTISNPGSITARGGNSGQSSYATGGAGAGGSILLKCQTASLGTGLINATGGTTTLPTFRLSQGGAGGDGRIHIDYLTSFTGTTLPALTNTQDSSLVSSEGVALRLQISDDGTAVEGYSKQAAIMTGSWQDVAVTWDASASLATFYVNGVSLGTDTGTFTVIDDNASDFAVGMYNDATSTPTGFYDGLIDEVRVWSTVLSNSDIILGLTDQINPSVSFLKAYYQFNGTSNDATSFANNLTLFNTPVYSTDVPFFGSTTRLDIDQSATTAGQTYTLPTTISEAATERLTFTPGVDPQKSIGVTIDTVGTGNWTITVHDQYDYVVASLTVLNANLNTSFYEFIFSTPWRPIIGNVYHFHLTSTVADGKVVTGTLNDLETAWFRTYFSFLINDSAWHPVSQMLNFLVIGNERYIATLSSGIYDSNAISLPAGWKVRCFGYWNEYLAIGAWRGSTISDFESGRIFFWDGVALTYNFFIDVPEGAVNAMVGSRGQLYFIAGYRGQLLIYEGGANARKLKNLINFDNQYQIEVYPGAMTMWRALLRFGIAGFSDDPVVSKGVYTWGAINERYPDSLSLDQTISTGTYTGTTIRIGMVQAVNQYLLIGWQDGNAYGVDAVLWGTGVYQVGQMNFLIEDDEMMFHEKQMVVIDTQFLPLLAGQSIQLQYKLNRNDNWTLLPVNNTPGATTERQVISTNGSRYREFQVGINLYTSVPTSPRVLSVSVERDMLETEKRVG